MAFIDQMREKLTQASQTTVQKAKDLSETAKLNSAVSNAEKQIAELYSKLGYEVYCAYCDKPLPEVVDLIEAINGLHKNIDEYKEQIKALNPGEICPQCGTKVSKGVQFCSSCGCRLVQPQPVVQPQGRICAGCGAALPEGALFCTSCGTKVG